MFLKRVLKHKTSFICYFEFHDLYLFTFSRLKSLPCPSSTHFAGQLAHVIGPLKCHNDDNNVMVTNVIHVLPSYPRFTLSSAFYPLIRVLLSYPFLPLVRPSVRPDIRPSIRPDVRPDIRPSIRPYPCCTFRRAKLRTSKSKFASSFANWLPNLEVRYVVSNFPAKFASKRGRHGRKDGYRIPDRRIPDRRIPDRRIPDRRINLVLIKKYMKLSKDVLVI